MFEDFAEKTVTAIKKAEALAVDLKDESVATGHIIYGPYINLTAGIYQLRLQYACAAPSSQEVGEMDACGSSGRKGKDDCRSISRGISGGTSIGSRVAPSRHRKCCQIET